MPPQIDADTMAAVRSFSNNFPVEPDIVLAAMLSTGSRIQGGASAQVQEIKQPIFHIRDHVSAVGPPVVAAAAQYSFFDENNATFCNISNGQIPAQTVFAWTGVGIDLITGVDRLGVAGGQACPSFPGAANVFSAAAMEAKRIILQTGFIEIKVGTQVVLYDPLTLHPLGSGLDAVWTNNVAAVSGGYASNGVPHVSNVRPISKTAELLAAGQQISARVILPSATIASLGTNVNGHWMLALFGSFFRKK